MSGTIETTNNSIIIKIEAIKNLITTFIENEICLNGEQEIIATLSDEYVMGSMNIISDYFLVSYKPKKETKELNEQEKIIAKAEKEHHYNKYQSFIRKENFISKLDKLMNNLKKHIVNVKDKTVLQHVYTLVRIYNNTTINKSIKEMSYEICVCFNKMDIDSVTSTLVCKKCGITNELYGTVFEDDQFYYQEGQRTKHGTYDPAKHCRFWVDRIQARETTEIPESVIKSIKECIIRDKIRNKNYINCDQIRKYLQQTFNSKYNDHIPLIRKLLTGVIPPQLTDYEIQLINIYFDKVIHIFDEIKPANKTNCPYNPYFIYKIIDQIIIKDSDRIKKLKILSCIHLQSRETLIQNDLIWETICSRIPEFKYIPTDRSSQYNEF